MTDGNPDFIGPIMPDGVAAIRAAMKRKARISFEETGATGEPVNSGRKTAKPKVDGAEKSTPRQRGFSVDQINREYALVLIGQKAVIVREQGEGPIEDRLRILLIDAFKHKFSNRFTEIVDRAGNIKAVSYAVAWLQHRKRRDFDGIEFYPDPQNTPNAPRYLNLWRGFAMKPAAKVNGYAIFDDHLLTNVCNGDRQLYLWVFGWFAHLVQRPRERPGTSLVFRGKMGTGKTKIGEVFGSLFPAHYFMVDDPRYIVGQFNSHMASCLLLQAEEAVWAGDKAAEGRLKGLITSKFQMIEAKGIDPIRLENYVRLIMTSNEDWVVPAGKDERRFCVLDVDPRCAQNHQYFREMDDELDNGGREALLHDLLAFDLSSVDLWTIPKTHALLEQKLRSFDPVESWWFERLTAGAITHKLDQWPASVPSEDLYDDFVATAEKVGVRRKAEQTAFGMKLRKLCPGLVRKRVLVDVGVGVTKRVWGYQLPPLDEARDQLEAIMGQTLNWGDET